MPALPMSRRREWRIGLVGTGLVIGSSSYKFVESSVSCAIDVELKTMDAGAC